MQAQNMNRLIQNAFVFLNALVVLWLFVSFYYKRPSILSKQKYEEKIENISERKMLYRVYNFSTLIFFADKQQPI